MASLVLGLVAAFCWGVHDLLVRKVSAAEGTFAALLSVLVFGTLFAVPLALVWGAPVQVPPQAYLRAIIAGLFYACAGIGLYKAFEIGPVRLVAPIIGAYPILSMLWATYLGSPLHAGHWAAVLVVIGGVAFIAVSSDDGASQGQKRAAISWSLMSGAGFAIAFAFSQSATQLSDEWTVMIPLRVTALAATLAVALMLRVRIWPRLGSLWIFAIMGALDVTALLAVSAAGGRAYPEFAAVGASTFGLVTVVLASIFLRESLKWVQWGAVLAVFAAIGSLGL